MLVFVEEYFCWVSKWNEVVFLSYLGWDEDVVRDISAVFKRWF